MGIRALGRYTDVVLKLSENTRMIPHSLLCSLSSTLIRCERYRG